MQSATLTIVKTDDAGAPLGGATFTLYTGTGPDLTATGYTCTTGDSGTCTITGIVPGAYTARESGVPAGYAPAA